MTAVPPPPSRPPLRVLDIGIAYGDDGTAYPTAVLDAAHRPDVLDLPRVHAIEGIGDLTTSLTPVAGGVVLTVRLTRPVRAEVAIRFDLPAHRAVLDGAARAGHLLLATTPPQPDAVHPPWLAVDVHGPSLLAALRAADPTGPAGG